VVQTPTTMPRYVKDDVEKKGELTDVEIASIP
jgi:hypothetical protein